MPSLCHGSEHAGCLQGGQGQACAEPQGQHQENESGRCSTSLYLRLPVKEEGSLLERERKSEVGAGTLRAALRPLGARRPQEAGGGSRAALPEAQQP